MSQRDERLHVQLNGRILGGKETTRLEDVRVVAADATVAGGSSSTALADGVTVELAPHHPFTTADRP
jgi:hypothetical protein